MLLSDVPTKCHLDVRVRIVSLRVRSNLFMFFVFSAFLFFFRFPSKIFKVEVVVSSLNPRYIIKPTNWRNVEISSAMKELFFKFCFDKKYSKTTKSTLNTHWVPEFNPQLWKNRCFVMKIIRKNTLRPKTHSSHGIPEI